MCTDCLNRNQGAYNEDKHPLDAKPYMDNNGASTKSGSVSEQGLPNGENMRYELTPSKTQRSSNIGTRGFGG